MRQIVLPAVLRMTFGRCFTYPWCLSIKKSMDFLDPSLLPIKESVNILPILWWNDQYQIDLRPLTKSKDWWRKWTWNWATKNVLAIKGKTYFNADTIQGTRLIRKRWTKLEHTQQHISVHLPGSYGRVEFPDSVVFLPVLSIWFKGIGNGYPVCHPLKYQRPFQDLGVLIKAQGCKSLYQTRGECAHKRRHWGSTQQLASLNDEHNSRVVRFILHGILDGSFSPDSLWSSDWRLCLSLTESAK